ncbi:ABC transporter permease [Paenibacillus silvisoli]|uniref:ABC transporter permease n=1 Tax=Paenibacillus silvisoli TaxID=3110539 RepID=UPI00280407C4|nr:ABC transporter permease subunit [Paenibacillus silvisoli]
MNSSSIRWSKIYRHRFLYLMVSPAILLVLLFSYLPLAGWIIAFKNYQIGLSVWTAKWIGFEQFKSFLFQSSDYAYLITNTLVMNITSIIVNLVTAVIFAILINEIRNKKFAKLVQTISFFPFFISWVIVYSIMSALFGASTGAFNQTLISAGLIDEGMNILGDPKYAWGLIVCLQLWKYLGYNGVIFIASIASISPDQYEAADIDGASRFQKIIYITIPSLMPTFVVMLIMNSGWILNSNFDLFYLFMNPTNWSKMEVLDMYIFKYGLQLTNYPYATAVGIIKSIVSIIILLGVNLIARKSTGRGIL